MPPLKDQVYSLILAGNPNVTAMFNGLVVATNQLREDLHDQTQAFTEIHIFHSEQSLSAMTSDARWKAQLLAHRIAHTTLVHHVIDLEDTTEERFADLVAQLKTIVNPLYPNRQYVDVTSGVSSIKAILSVFAYVLDVQNVFSMEIRFSGDPENRRRQTALFYDELVQEPGVTIAYRRLPNISEFDAFGKLNYTEVLRYRRLYGELSVAAASNHGDVDRAYLESLLLDGINSRLTGDLTGDPAHYRHAVFSFAAAVEELAKVWLESLGEGHEGKTLGDKLASIRERLRTSALYFIDEKTLEHLTILLNAIRTDVVHSKSRSSRSPELARLQADLVRQLTEAFGAFVVTAISSFLGDNGQPVQPKRLRSDEIKRDSPYLFGLDGDGTGEFLEGAFEVSTNNTEEVRRRSEVVSKALHEIGDFVRQKTQNDSAIVFAQGDNMLFKANYDSGMVGRVQAMYLDRTGLRCSIGFGLSLREVSIAMKLAKADTRGIVGISL